MCEAEANFRHCSLLWNLRQAKANASHPPLFSLVPPPLVRSCPALYQHSYSCVHPVSWGCLQGQLSPGFVPQPTAWGTTQDTPAGRVEMALGQQGWGWCSGWMMGVMQWWGDGGHAGSLLSVAVSAWSALESAVSVSAIISCSKFSERGDPRYRCVVTASK